jgi:hypothetical protein
MTVVLEGMSPAQEQGWPVLLELFQNRRKRLTGTGPASVRDRSPAPDAVKGWMRLLFREWRLLRRWAPPGDASAVLTP